MDRTNSHKPSLTDQDQGARWAATGFSRLWEYFGQPRDAAYRKAIDTLEAQELEPPQTHDDTMELFRIGSQAAYELMIELGRWSTAIARRKVSGGGTVGEVMERLKVQRRSDDASSEPIEDGSLVYSSAEDIDLTNTLTDGAVVTIVRSPGKIEQRWFGSKEAGEKFMKALRQPAEVQVGLLMDGEGALWAGVNRYLCVVEWVNGRTLSAYRRTDLEEQAFAAHMRPFEVSPGRYSSKEVGKACA